MFYWVKKLIDPNYIIRLFAEKGGVEAVLEFDRNWLVALPKELLRRLTFDDCKSLLNQLPKNRKFLKKVRRQILFHRASELADTFDDYRFLYDFDQREFDGLYLSEVDQEPWIKSTAHCFMISFARNLEDCRHALSLENKPFGRSLSDDSQLAHEFFQSFLLYCRTSEEYAEVGIILNSRPFERANATHAWCCARQTIRIAADAIRIYRFDPNSNDDSTLLQQAFDLSRTEEDFLEVALLATNNSDLRLRAIEEAKKLAVTPADRETA